MNYLKKYKEAFCFHLIVNLIFLLLISYSTFYHVPLVGFKDRISYGILLIALQFTVFGFLYFLSLNKFLFYFFFPIIFLASGLSAFWVYTQDIVINAGVVQATMETRPDVVSDLASYQLTLYLVVLALVLFFMLRWYAKLKNNRLGSPLTLMACLAVLTFFVVEYKRGATFKNRLPYNLIYSVQEYYNKPIFTLKSAPQELASKSDSLQVIFVLGESVRADHIQMNAYPRPTMPLLSKRKNLVSFPDTYTTKTYTGISVPQILTDQSIYDSDEKSHFYSLIDALNKAKINTYWIGNQTPEKSYKPFIDESQIKKLVDPYHSEFSFSKDLDGKMLPYLTEYFAPDRNQFLLFHMMGSHWYYENRYDSRFRKFLPIIKSKHIASNSPEEMVNSYDNTLVYLDYFLDQMITYLDQQNSNTVLIYLSDHGENLGENGKWLHAQEGEAVNRPALFVWYSEKFKEKYPEKVVALNERKKKDVTHDFFFHTVIKLFGIKGFTANNDQDLFRN